MDLLTVQETATMLRVAPITVRRYIASGKLAAVRVGRGVRVERDAVHRLVEPVIAPVVETSDDAFEGVPIAADDPLWQIVGMFGSGSSGSLGSIGRPLTKDDSLFRLIGIAASDPDEPTDVAANHDKYLADAYADLHEE